MRSRPFFLSLLGTCLLSTLVARFALPRPGHRGKERPPFQSRVPQSRGNLKLSKLLGLPLIFEPNHGQAGRQAQFIARGSGYNLFLTREGVVWGRRRNLSSKIEGRRLRMRFLHSQDPLAWTGIDPLRGRANYFLGNDPHAWQLDVPLFGSARATVALGVDMLVRGEDQNLEYDLVVAPGSDPRQLRFRLEGADDVVLNSEGELVAQSGDERLRMKRPTVYQTIGEQRIKVEAGYNFGSDGEVQFEISNFNPHAALVIDPSISITYDTFIGGSGADSVNSVGIDSTGKAYISGTTSALDFPELGAVRIGSLSGTSHLFVAKLDPTVTGANSLLYLAFLGGSGDDEGGVLAVDSSQKLVIVGKTTSSDFPMANPFQNRLRGASDLTISKLNAAGNALVFSTYLGGSSAEATQNLEGVAIDDSNNIFVTSDTASTDLPVTLGAFRSQFGGGASDGFLATFTPAGTLSYCTYLGIDATVGDSGVAVDGSGNAYLTGFTSQPSGTSFPTAHGFQPSYGGGPLDAFVMKLSPKGLGSADLIYSTFLGGESSDQAFGIGIDTSTPPKAYVMGTTLSGSFPVNGKIAPFQSKLAGSSDAFLAVIAQDATSLATSLSYSTYLGAGIDQGLGVSVVAPNVVYVVGKTNSIFFPTVNTLQAFSGTEDAFVAQFDPTVSGTASLAYSTLLGGGHTAQANAIAADSSGNAFVGGATDSSDFPLASHAQNGFQLTCASCGETPPLTDGFLTEITESIAPAPIVSFFAPQLNFGSQPVGAKTVPPQTEVITNTGNANLVISTLTIVGANASDFSLLFASDCQSTTLGPGNQCSFEVGFAPTQPGTETASVSVADNASGSPQSVSLLGVGTAPLAKLSPTTLNFGNQPENTSSNAQIATLSNIGNATLDITGMNLGGSNAIDFFLSGGNTCVSSGSVPPGSSCIMSVVFAPLSTGNFTAEIDVTDDSDNVTGATQVVQLTGTGTPPAPEAALTPSSLNFGSEVVESTSGPAGVTLKNTGSLPLQIAIIAITGTNSSDFNLVSSGTNCPSAGQSLAPGAICTVAVDFAPLSTGAKSAALSFSDNSVPSPQLVPLTGTAIAPIAVLSANSLVFGSQSDGIPSSAQTVTLSNSGNAPLTIISIATLGTNPADFGEINNCPPELNPGLACTISVTFDPIAAGARTASLSIQDNAAGSPQSVSLSGTGLAAEASLAPAILTFSGQLVGTTSAAIPVILTADGTGAVATNKITFSGANPGDFSATNQCIAGVNPGHSCAIDVTFKPSGDGNRNAVMNVIDNAVDSPQNVSLSGTGTDFSLSAAAGGSTAATVTAGQDATYHLQLIRVDGFTGSVALACTGAPSEAACTPSAAMLDVKGASAVDFSVRVTTAARSTTVPSARLRPGPRLPLQLSGPESWAVLLLLLFVTAVRRRRELRWALRTFGLLAALAILLAACGGGGIGGGSSGTPAGTFTLVVSGTQSGGTRQLNLTLTVQ